MMGTPIVVGKFLRALSQTCSRSKGSVPKAKRVEKDSKFFKIIVRVVPSRLELFTLTSKRVIGCL